MAVLPTAGRRALQLIRSCGVGRVHASSYHSTTVERNADVSPAPAATAGAQQATSSIHDMAYSPSWYALGVNEELRVMMKKTGAKKHSNLIQAKCLPPMLQGHNVLVHALPGSGLTTAYCIAICDRIMKSLANAEMRREVIPADEKPGVLTTKEEKHVIDALQSATAIGARALVLVKDAVQVQLVAKRFNKYFGKTFRACALYEKSDLVMTAETAVLVMTPQVLLGMELPSLMRRIDTIVLDSVCEKYVLDQVLALPPPRTTAINPVAGTLPDENEDDYTNPFNRQLIGIVDNMTLFGQASSILARDPRVVLVRAPPDPDKLRQPAYRVSSHLFVRAEDEKAALRTVVTELHGMRSTHYDTTLQASHCKRVLVIASRQMNPEALANLWAVVTEPQMVHDVGGKEEAWFKNFRVSALFARLQRESYKLFSNGSVPLMVTTQDFATGLHFQAPLDAVIFYGMPDPQHYFEACRHVQYRRGCVITVYDESRAALVDVLQALSRPSPPKLSETHNDMLWQLVSTTLNMRDVRNMSDYVQAVSPQALKKIAGSVADIDSLAAQVGAGLYARRRPRRPLDGERRMRK
ncbi:uncharacterized protein LOC135818119 [Sycon ciliatum]|uniref:uncharacterized protein LOC135818119 n=1 Tax=Sycon ciliatum TaxID=27933 RepID=UPI0031F619F6